MSHSFSSNWMGLDFTFIVGCTENPGGAAGISPGLGRFNWAQSLGCSWKKLQFFFHFFFLSFFFFSFSFTCKCLLARFARFPLWSWTPCFITYIFWFLGLLCSSSPEHSSQGRFLSVGNQQGLCTTIPPVSTQPAFWQPPMFGYNPFTAFSSGTVTSSPAERLQFTWGNTRLCKQKAF